MLNIKSEITGLRPTDVARFWIKVNKTDCCWEWTAGCFDGGYGAFWCGGNNQLAHRVSWKIHTGSESLLFVCHHCDNTKCVRPSHLFEGTPLDNVTDKISKGRDAKGEDLSNSKLTEAKALEIFHSEGTCAAVGDLYGVHATLVHAIRQGRRWAHVTQAH